MTKQHAEQNFELMICSVGGAPQPILFSLTALRPKYVVFFCSTDTVDNVGDFIRQCSFIEKHSVIETENIEDIDENLQLLYKELPKHLARRGVSWDKVIVDYTGGTKTMGASLVLATVDKGVQYSYISGKERSKEGIGIVIDGTEKMLLKSNPWNSIAYQQRKDISNAFNYGRYDEAITLSETLKNHLSNGSRWKEIFSGLIYIFEAYQEWDKFRHKQALDSLKRGISKVTPYSHSESSIADLIKEVEKDLEILDNLNSKVVEEKSNYLLNDLIANAIRRGKNEQKYDDGVARLYRALELIAQNQLIIKFNINSGKCQLNQIPESIRDEYQRKYWIEEANCLKFGLHASYNLLYELGDETGKIYEDRKEDILKRLIIRNQSILAHGLQPVTAKGYEEMLEVVLNMAQIEEQDLVTFPKITL